MDYKVDQDLVHLIAYHLILVSRCRILVLVNDVAKDFVTLIRRKCKASRVSSNSNIIRRGNNKYDINTDDPKAG